MSSPRKSASAEGPGADVVLHGTVAPGFEEVREELRRNFTERHELGASCAVYLRGQKVVDLWGGWKDASTREPWQEDTCALVFSTTKGMAAITAAVAHSRGWLDYDAPVAAYWPEFAQAGKSRITVRQLLAHQAGLPALDEAMDPVKLADLDYLARVLARQAPAWEPGTRHGYHSFTIGWYLGELIRRVDPRHRSLGRFFQEEVAAPLGIHFHIGLPPDVPASRVARLQAIPSLQVLFHEHSLPASMLLAFLWPRSLTARALGNPRSRKLSDFDTPEYRPLELPAAGGIGQARAVARAYGSLATGGHELGLTPATLAALTAPPVLPTQGTFDQVLKAHTAFSLGYTRRCPTIDFGPNPRAFGASGAGGSLGFADPDAQLGFGYVMNRAGLHLMSDPRARALRDAVYRCLARLPGSTSRAA
ncbi:beta-lactamase family protein [Archangium gephyra]|uniref:serine hydrolase domain-containing protein n=1 Tax=Archangium gephyra TaxID=48 RepID=UPI0035D4407C